jgi:hypothetical protein
MKIKSIQREIHMYHRDLQPCSLVYQNPRCHMTFTSKLGPNIRDYHLADYELQLQINRILRPLRLS